MKMLRTLFAVAVAVAGSTLASRADDAADALAKQHLAVKANIKAGKVTLATAETADLIVSAPYPAERVAKIAADVQKAYTAALKTLTYEAKDDPIAGKLAVYVITDPKAHKIFLLQALKRSPRGKEAVDVQLRGDTPQIVISAGADEKPTEAGVTAQASRAVASALLNVKAGTTTDDAGLPGWLEAGFGNAVALRVDGNASKLAAHRAKVKALAQKSQGQALQLKAVSGDAPSADADVLVTSFLEYLVFGPGAEKFPAILTALKPGEGNETPTIWTAFTAADWKTEAVEANWRRWVLTGK